PYLRRVHRSTGRRTRPGPSARGLTVRAYLTTSIRSLSGLRIMQTAPDLVLTGEFRPDQLQHYTHIPFEVPSGVHQLHLRYGCNNQIDSDPTLSGGNTLDLGLFDQRGTEAGGPGFRG